MLPQKEKPRTGVVNLRLLSIIPLTLSCLFFSRNSYSFDHSGTVQKKQVTRIVDIGTGQTQDSTLFEMLISDISGGKIPAYVFDGGRFASRLAVQQLKKSLAPDTTIIVDSVTGRERKIAREFDFRAVHKYKILEEWTYDPHTQKAEIEIVGIGPVKEIYTPGGDFLGYSTVCWMRSKDVQPLLERYDQRHSANKVATCIWNDYFKDSRK